VEHVNRLWGMNTFWCVGEYVLCAIAAGDVGYGTTDDASEWNEFGHDDFRPLRCYIYGTALSSEGSIDKGTRCDQPHTGRLLEYDLQAKESCSEASVRPNSPLPAK